MKYQQTKDLETPNYYKNETGEDLFTQFKNGLINKEEFTGFLKGNAFKYLQRYNLKDQKESDLYKLKDYIITLADFLVLSYEKSLNKDAKKKLNEELELLLVFTPQTKSDIADMYRSVIFNKLKSLNSRLVYASKMEKIVSLILLVDMLIDLELGDEVKFNEVV